MKTNISEIQQRYPMQKQYITKYVVAWVFWINFATLVFITTANTSGYWWFVILIGSYFAVRYYYKIHMYTYRYDVTDTNICIKHGILSPREIIIPLKNVQDVLLYQDLLDNQFKIYTISITSFTAGSVQHARIAGLNEKDGDELHKFILEKISKEEVITADVDDLPHSQLNETEDSEISNENHPISPFWLVKVALINAVFWFIVDLLLVLFHSGYPEQMKTTSHLIQFALIGAFVCTLFAYTMRKILKFHFRSQRIDMSSNFSTLKQERSFSYSKIQTVYIHQSILDKIFGIATLIVETASALRDNDGSFPFVRIGSVGNKLYIPGLKKVDAENIRDFVLRKMKSLIS